MGRACLGLLGFVWFLGATVSPAQELYLSPRNSNQSAATLGQPVPAATLGRPVAVDSRDASSSGLIHTVSYPNYQIGPPLRPIIAPALPNRDSSTPMLA